MPTAVVICPCSFDFITWRLKIVSTAPPIRPQQLSTYPTFSTILKQVEQIHEFALPVWWRAISLVFDKIKTPKWTVLLNLVQKDAMVWACGFCYLMLGSWYSVLWAKVAEYRSIWPTTHRIKTNRSTPCKCSYSRFSFFEMWFYVRGGTLACLRWTINLYTALIDIVGKR